MPLCRLRDSRGASPAQPTGRGVPRKGYGSYLPPRAACAALRCGGAPSSLRVKKGGHCRLIGRTKGGVNMKLHAICDSKGRPIDFFVSEVQVSDLIGSRALLSSLPKVGWLLGGRGYGADWFREALQDKGIRACIPGRKQLKTAVKYDKRRYKRRNRIEIMFGRLKRLEALSNQIRQIPKTFFSAITLAAIVIYWLWVLTLGNGRTAGPPRPSAICNASPRVVSAATRRAGRRCRRAPARATSRHRHRRGRRGG